MAPLGKLTLAIIGLRLFGADGFFVGLIIGHFAIDRTHLIISLQRRLSILDDNIRLMLPYKYYHYYNQIDGSFWGKLWGAVLGFVLFGLYGMIFLFSLGHFVFDTPKSRHAKYYREMFENFWDKNWGKIIGAVTGFVLASKLVLFCGIIIGFFADYHRLEKPWNFKFNPLKLWKYSHEARHVAFVRSVAGLAAKVAKADGVVSENEIRTFRKLFDITENDHSVVAKVFNEARKTSKGYSVFIKPLLKITKDNLDLKENIIDNLFQIARADADIKPQELDLLSKIAAELELPQGNFEMIKKLYLPTPKDVKMQNCYDVLGIICTATAAEVKARWKELIVENHPDRIQSEGGSEQEIELATAKMAEINRAYQEIMKTREER